MQTGWKNILLPLLPEEPARILRALPEGQVREVRLRLHQPMEVVLTGESRLFTDLTAGECCCRKRRSPF